MQTKMSSKSIKIYSLCRKFCTNSIKSSKLPKIATKITENRQKIASRQAKILSPTGSQNRQLGDKSPFLVTLVSIFSFSFSFSFSFFFFSYFRCRQLVIVMCSGQARNPKPEGPTGFLANPKKPEAQNLYANV